jgi:rRNA maturation RNase YbeY
MVVRISGNTEDITDDINLYSKIVRRTCDRLDVQAKSVDVIFVDDPTLRELHRIYLHDDSNTDVMTFNLGEEGVIEGEIYISLPRALEQSKEFDVTVQEELIRLLIHGCLHLAGYDDQEDEQRRHMKKLEDELVSEAAVEFL